MVRDLSARAIGGTVFGVLGASASAGRRLIAAAERMSPPGFGRCRPVPGAPLAREPFMEAQEISPNARYDVLVVDDDRDCADSLVEVLRVCFEIEAEPAYGGSQALNAARAHPPAAIVLDLDMPLVDGLKTANDLLEAFPDHPPSLIAVTGNPDLWRAASNDRRFTGALLKPPDPHEVARAILRAAEVWRRVLR